MSSHEVKNQKEKPEEAPLKSKDNLSFLTTEKSLEISTEPNEFMKTNVANCYIFMSPAQRQKLISTPMRRKWIIIKNPMKKKESEKTLNKDTPLTKSAQNFEPLNKNMDKNRGTHLYRQGVSSSSEIKNFGRKKQLNAKFTLKGHLDGVRSLAVSNDKTTLISASEDLTLKLWDIKDIDRTFENSAVIEPFFTFRDHKGPIFTISNFNQNSNSQSHIPSNLILSGGSEVNINSLI